jgi:hypothetical protein
MPPDYSITSGIVKALWGKKENPCLLIHIISIMLFPSFIRVYCCILSVLGLFSPFYAKLLIYLHLFITNLLSFFDFTQSSV